MGWPVEFVPIEATCDFPDPHPAHLYGWTEAMVFYVHSCRGKGLDE